MKETLEICSRIYIMYIFYIFTMFKKPRSFSRRIPRENIRAHRQTHPFIIRYNILLHDVCKCTYEYEIRIKSVLMPFFCNLLYRCIKIRSNRKIQVTRTPSRTYKQNDSGFSSRAKNSKTVHLN